MASCITRDPLYYNQGKSIITQMHDLCLTYQHRKKIFLRADFFFGLIAGKYQLHSG